MTSQMSLHDSVTVLCLASCSTQQQQFILSLEQIFSYDDPSHLEFYFDQQQMLLVRSDESCRMLQLISYSQSQSVGLMIIRIPAI